MVENLNLVLEADPDRKTLDQGPEMARTARGPGPEDALIVQGQSPKSGKNEEGQDPRKVIDQDLSQNPKVEADPRAKIVQKVEAVLIAVVGLRVEAGPRVEAVLRVKAGPRVGAGLRVEAVLDPNLKMVIALSQKIAKDLKVLNVKVIMLNLHMMTLLMISRRNLIAHKSKRKWMNLIPFLKPIILNTMKKTSILK